MLLQKALEPETAAEPPSVALFNFFYVLSLNLKTVKYGKKKLYKILPNHFFRTCA